MSASVKYQNGLSEITKSFLLQVHRTEEISLQRTSFLGAVAATGAGAGLSLGDPIENGACTALSIFNTYNDNNELSRDFEAAKDAQQRTILTLQRVQAKNNDNFLQPANELKKTQNKVKQIKDLVVEHLRTMDANVRTTKVELIAYKECRLNEMVYLRFLQEIRNFIWTWILSILTSNLTRQRFMPTRSTCSLQFHLSQKTNLHVSFSYQTQIKTP